MGAPPSRLSSIPLRLYFSARTTSRQLCFALTSANEPARHPAIQWEDILPQDKSSRPCPGHRVRRGPRECDQLSVAVPRSWSVYSGVILGVEAVIASPRRRSFVPPTLQPNTKTLCSLQLRGLFIATSNSKDRMRLCLGVWPCKEATRVPLKSQGRTPPVVLVAGLRMMR